MQTKKAKDLIFISQIKRDGSGVIHLDNAGHRDTIQKQPTYGK